MEVITVLNSASLVKPLSTCFLHNHLLFLTKKLIVSSREVLDLQRVTHIDCIIGKDHSRFRLSQYISEEKQVLPVFADITEGHQCTCKHINAHDIIWLHFTLVYTDVYNVIRVGYFT